MKNTEPLVSVIIPVYNVEKYVEKCLETVASQSYKNLEIVIVDDGSTDKSGKICDNFITNDARMRVYHKKNGGLSDARNYGIKKSHGEFVVLVDSDDFVEKNYVETMMSAALDDKSDIVICGYNNVSPKRERITGKEATERLLVRQENLEIVAWNKLYRRVLFSEIEYPLGRKYEDTLTTYKLLAAAGSVSYVPESLYNYVERAGSIMDTGKTLDRLKVREEAARDAIDYFAKDKDLKKAAEVSLVLAKYAFINSAIRGEISEEYYSNNIKWIKTHSNKFANNPYVTKKIKIYNLLVRLGLYKVFRKVKP